MSQVLLFSIGTCIFALTVVGALFYGYFTFTQFYNASVAVEASLPTGATGVVASALVTD